MLSIFNESFSKGVVPLIWKEANLLPLKRQANRQELSPPTDLSACVVKTMERMVHNRLYNLAETRGWHCSEQAAFCKLRCCEGRILRTTQTIRGGFQGAKPQRSLMYLLDFPKDFDRVWREELLAASSTRFRSLLPAGGTTFYQSTLTVSRLTAKGMTRHSSQMTSSSTAVTTTGKGLHRRRRRMEHPKE